jgi:hypothetical protein
VGDAKNEIVAPAADLRDDRRVSARTTYRDDVCMQVIDLSSKSLVERAGAVGIVLADQIERTAAVT